MNFQNPLDIPEIRLHVGTFLTPRSLRNCTLVCKDWKDTFSPLFWKDVYLNNNASEKRLIGTSTSFYSNCIYIQSLNIKVPYLELFCYTYPNLKYLTLESNAQYPRVNSYYSPLINNIHVPANSPYSLNANVNLNNNVYSPFAYPQYVVPSHINEPYIANVAGSCGSVDTLHLLAIVRLNTHLKSLSIIKCPIYPNAKFWNAISTLPHLTNLSLKSVRITYSDVKHFWNACTRLETLSMDSTFIQSLVQDHNPRLDFPKLQTLHFKGLHGIDHNAQVEIARQCPALKEWSWHPIYTNATGPTIELFLDGIESNRWLHLESLSIGFQFEARTLSRIVQHMKRIKKLSIYHNNFSPEFFDSLQPHYSTLVELTLFDYSTASDGTLYGVFYLLPNLESLNVGRVNVNDIIAEKPWACTSLRTLRVCFIFNQGDKDLQKPIFDQLSRLVRLQVLGIGGWISMDPVPFGESLDLRLESGLGSLSTLQNLRLLNMELTTQKLCVQEIEWMITNWTMLEALHGRLCSDSSIYTALRDILRKNNISTDS